ncbi:GtrA family protein [Paenibacillus sp. CAU 1782]
MYNSGKKDWVPQLFKFGLVGVLNTLIDFAVFTLLIVMSVHYALAQPVAYLAGMVNSYYMNRAFTFSARKRGQEISVPAARGGDWGRKLRFLIWNLVMLGLSVGLIALATEVAGLHEMVSKVLVTGLIVVLNFVGSKLWVFAEAPSVSKEH